MKPSLGTIKELPGMLQETLHIPDLSRAGKRARFV
jgi:hypothetical protein